MTLRGRLTIAFLAVVLAPIVVSALTVGCLATGQARQTETENLRNGGNAITTTVASLCQRARSAADVLASEPAVTGSTPDYRVIGWLVQRGTVDLARIADQNGKIVIARGTVSNGLLEAPWGGCVQGKAPNPILAANSSVTDEQGNEVGIAQGAFVVDDELIRQFCRVSGLDVALELPDGGKLGNISGDSLRTKTLTPHAGQPLRITIATPHHNLRGLYVTLILITVAIAGIAVLAATWLASTLTRPLAELAHAAEQVGIGNLATRVPVRGKDETARLARTFNRMIRDLEQYVEALQASRNQLRNYLTNLGHALSSGRDPTSILEVTVQTAMAATGARAGIVLTTKAGRHPNDPYILIGRYGQGLPENVDIANLQIPFGTGMLGDIAETKTPRRGRISPSNNDLSPLEPPCRTYIAVPFMPPDHVGRPLGVLALYDRLGAGERADDFDDTDLDILQRFSTQAASAFGPAAPGSDRASS